LLSDALAVGVIKRANQFRRPASHAVDVMSLAIFDSADERRFDLHLGQDSLSEIILRHLERLPHATVRWSSRVTGVAQADDGVSVAVDTREGPGRVPGDWLIGADGSHSVVRRQLGLKFDGRTWPDRFVATNVYFDFEAHGFGRATFVRDPANWAIIIKIRPDGLWRVAYGEEGTLTEEEVRARIGQRYRDILPGNDRYQLEAVASCRVHERCAGTFRAGRVLLAGDAAHICNPAGGFGLMGGLVDTNALSWALAAHLSGKEGEEIVDHYAQERRSIFLQATSPLASEFKRVLSEADPEKMRRDDDNIRRACSDPETMPIAAAVSTRLAGAFPLNRAPLQSRKPYDHRRLGNANFHSIAGWIAATRGSGCRDNGYLS
jgi:2-polyprenyl-6-methoxyphenol hydroxylase-like FAD-dependent oxidoreductase